MSSAPSEESVVPPALEQAWRSGKPSAVELQRGYARYLRRRAPRKRPFGIARWVVGGLVLGAGLAQAASMTPWQRWFGQNQLVSQPAPPVQAPARQQVAPARLPLQVTPSSAPVSALAPVAAPSSSASAPRTAATPNAPSAPSAAAFRIQEQWRLAAEGLRSNDFNRAHTALLELERTTGGGERDAARLARAQLLSSHARGAEALALSRDLEAHASSSLVRDKARELRERLTKTSGADRSTAAPSGINQP